MTRKHRAQVSAALLIGIANIWGLCSCNHFESEDEEPQPKLISYKRQPKFKATDFTFVNYQDAHDDGRGALWGTCLRVGMLDGNGRTWGCGFGITIPKKGSGDRSLRMPEEASRQATLAINFVRKQLLSFKHADARTCRLFQQMMEARLTMKRNGWKQSQVRSCDNYVGKPLPAFDFERGMLLIGDYREWSKEPMSKP